VDEQINSTKQGELGEGASGAATPHSKVQGAAKWVTK